MVSNTFIRFEFTYIILQRFWIRAQNAIACGNMITSLLKLLYDHINLYSKLQYQHHRSLSLVGRVSRGILIVDLAIMSWYNRFRSFFYCFLFWYNNGDIHGRNELKLRPTYNSSFLRLQLILVFRGRTIS